MPPANQNMTPYQRKRQAIEKSLVHRAQLRRKYFKMLEKENLSVPAKPEHDADSKNTMTHKDRMELVKQRKLRKIQEQKDELEKQKRDKVERAQVRQKHRISMQKHTAKGQPSMGPRINRLLDKIRQEQ